MHSTCVLSRDGCVGLNGCGERLSAVLFGGGVMAAATAETKTVETEPIMSTAESDIANEEEEQEEERMDSVNDTQPSFYSSSRHLYGTRGGSTTTKDIINSTLQKNKPKPRQTTLTLSDILSKSWKKAMNGGLPGAIAGVIQVLTLMWLRTVVNYQCRYGAPFKQSLSILYKDGGVRRFYRGLPFAIVQAPLSKFVATAANEGVHSLLGSLNFSSGWGAGRVTIVASVVVGVWRIFLMPIDTCKTVLQVDSNEGFRNLIAKVKAGNIEVLYSGAIANAISSALSNYPWFYIYNLLSTNAALQNFIPMDLVRNASIGFIASIISDTVTNCIRVVKTTKQSVGAKHSIGYREVIQLILAADGWKGLFGRGLKTRILGNAIQSVVFTVIWRGLAERWSTTASSSSTTDEKEDVDHEDVNDDMIWDDVIEEDESS